MIAGEGHSDFSRLINGSSELEASLETGSSGDLSQFVLDTSWQILDTHAFQKPQSVES